MLLIAAVRDCSYCPGAENPSLPYWLPFAVAGVGLACVTLLLVASAILRIQGRQAPTWVVPAAFAFGVGASLMVVLWPIADVPIGLALLVAGVLGAPAFAAQARRFDLAGWILVGAGIPALLWWGQFVLQDILHEAIRYEDGLVVWFASAVGVALLGLVGIVLGNRIPAPPPRPQSHEPDPERTVAIAHAIQKELRFGPLDFPNVVSIGVAMGAGTIVGFTLRRVGVPDLLTGIAWAATFSLIATELFYHVWPPRLARVMGAHAFVGSWELERFRRTAGPTAPTSARAARDWLVRYPETDANRWVRPELLTWAGELEEAYQVIERMPASTDAERFERHATKALVDLVSGVDVDLEALAGAAETVGGHDSDERLRARVVVALQRSRQLVVDGSADWMAPLLDAQERIGPRALGIMRGDTWLTRFKAAVIISGSFLVIGSLLTYLSG